jgi:hypothetical protein
LFHMVIHPESAKAPTQRDQTQPALYPVPSCHQK